MNNRVIVTAIDNNYVLPLLVMINSAKQHSSKDFHLIIGFIREELSEENRQLIESVLSFLQISFHFNETQIDNELRGFAHISRTTFVRLYLPENLKGTVLWLDPDLLCFQGWEVLFNVENFDRGNFVIAGVPDPVVTHPNFQKVTKNMAAKKSGGQYFNSGVVLINCDLFNEFDIPSKWKSIIKDYDALGFQFLDQCILNYVCKDLNLLLPNKFNQLAFVQRDKFARDSSILHFAGTSKPWDYSKYGIATLISILKRRDIVMYLKIQKNTISIVKKCNKSDYKALKKMEKASKQKKNLGDLTKERILLWKNLPRY